MNWQQIKEQHPKAWAEFEVGKMNLTFNIKGELVWVCSDGVHATCIHIAFNTRDLYDFFDSKGIYVTIGFEVFEKNLFTWLAEDEEETILASGQEIPLNTRTEAESQAFTRAFQILEERLAA